jgi:hypothetical protein
MWTARDSVAGRDGTSAPEKLIFFPDLKATDLPRVNSSISTVASLLFVAGR